MALGNVAVRAGNFDLAITQFQTVLRELDKDSKSRGDVYFRLGITLRRKGDFERCHTSRSTKRREALPGNPLVVNELALALQTADRQAGGPPGLRAGHQAGPAEWNGPE